MITTNQIADRFKDIQDKICSFLVNDTKQDYHEDNWNYNKGKGGGRTRVWESDNNIIEKGGVNFSFIKGNSLPKAATEAHNLPDNKFKATGVSIVIHPYNPHIPTIHMNIRYFCTGETWWFGGGIDLTPYYPQKKQIIFFHKELKTICDKYSHSYDNYKTKCDEYFYLPHRNEARGIGGIFFDQLNTKTTNKTKNELFDFVCELGLHFIVIYQRFIQENIHLQYSNNQREFQLIRRSRYVEFNLLWDRGTKFGIQSNGRTESILMSMPAKVIWKYDYSPKKDSEEYKLLEYYFKPKDWINMDDNE